MDFAREALSDCSEIGSGHRATIAQAPQLVDFVGARAGPNFWMRRLNMSTRQTFPLTAGGISTRFERDYSTTTARKTRRLAPCCNLTK